MILICSRMKELTFSRFITELRGQNGFCSLLFYRENGPLDKELSFFFLKMAADHGISLSCFLEVEVILEV